MTLLSIALRNTRRELLRALLTVVAVAAGVLTFVLLRTVVTSWHEAADYAQRDRISTRNRMSFTLPLPRHTADLVRTVDGVKHATFMTYFNGKSPRHPDRFFVNFAADPSSFLEVYDEVVLTPEERRAWLADRQGAIVGSVLARQLGLRPGDRLTLQGSTYPGEWTLRISAIYESARKSFNASSLVFHWAYLNAGLPESMRDQVTLVNARVATAARGAEVSAAIDRLFESASTPTETLTERMASLSSMGLFSAVLDALDLVAALIALILGLILANTMLMAARERTREHAVLRAIGFTPRQLCTIALLEAGALGACSALLALTLALPLEHLLARVVQESMAGLFPLFRVRSDTALTALLATPALGATAGALAAWSSLRVPVSRALRAVD